MGKIKLKLGERVRLVKPDVHTISCHGLDVGDCGVVVEEEGRKIHDSVCVYAYVVFDKFKEEDYVGGGKYGIGGYNYRDGIPIAVEEVEVIVCGAWQVRMLGGVGVGFEIDGGDEVVVLRKALKELGWEVVKV